MMSCIDPMNVVRLGRLWTIPLLLLFFLGSVFGHGIFLGNSSKGWSYFIFHSFSVKELMRDRIGTNSEVESVSTESFHYQVVRGEKQQDRHNKSVKNTLIDIGLFVVHSERGGGISSRQV